MKHLIYLVPLSLLVALWLLLGVGHPPRRAHAQVTLPTPVKVNVPAGVLFGDEFGYAVALDGDYLVIAAPRTIVGNNDQQGVVYLYQRVTGSADSFAFLKTLTASDGKATDSFGTALTLNGDTLVVGAIYADPGGLTNQGAAYVFARDQGGANHWGEVKKLTRSDTAKLVNFGSAMALVEDTLVIGSPTINGRAFVYERNAGGANNWGQTQILANDRIFVDETHSYADENDTFGSAIAFDGTTLVIGAEDGDLGFQDIPPQEVPPPETPLLENNNAGTVLVFTKENGQWVRKARLFHNDVMLDDRNSFQIAFGREVALHDGRIFVAASNGSVNGAKTGKVFVFEAGADTSGQWGTPGGWGETAVLNASDGAGSDSFGSALYAVSNGLFVTASGKGANGTVYFYRNTNTRRTVATVAPQSWAEIYSFTDPEGGAGSLFGRPMTGGGNNLLISARGTNSVFAYPVDQMLTADGALPSSSKTVYLPLVSRQTTPIQPMEVIAGELANATILTGPAGMTIGAVTGALSNTMAITLATLPGPSVALPTGMTARSRYFRLQSATNLMIDLQTPLIVGLPVVAGAATSHLGLAYLQPRNGILDGAAGGLQWTLLPVVYDATQQVIYTKLAYLAAAGRELVVVENADLASPLNAPTAQAATASSEYFYSNCVLFAKPADCTDATGEQVAALLSNIYANMAFTYTLPTKPRLLDTSYQVIVTRGYTFTTGSRRFGTFIYPKTEGYCNGAAGYYTPETGSLVLCLAPQEALTPNTEKVLAHEYFHSIEYSYRRVMDNRTQNLDEDWIIEGMATAVMDSHTQQTMRRTFFYGEHTLHDVDVPLNSGTVEEPLLTEYLAQDFWVFLGRHYGHNMGYLGFLLARGGATTTDTIAAIESALGERFADVYWAWSKNQVFEGSDNLGGGIDTNCELITDALTNWESKVFTWTAASQHYPITDTYEALPPLTTAVVEVVLPHTKASAAITVDYGNCPDSLDAITQFACRIATEKVIHAKIYEQNEANCSDASLPGMTNPPLQSERTVAPGVGKRFFVVIANGRKEQEHLYGISVE